MTSDDAKGSLVRKHKGTLLWSLDRGGAPFQFCYNPEYCKNSLEVGRICGKQLPFHGFTPHPARPVTSTRRCCIVVHASPFTSPPGVVEADRVLERSVYYPHSQILGIS